MHKRMAETEESLPNLQDDRLEHCQEAKNRMNKSIQKRMKILFFSVFGWIIYFTHLSMDYYESIERSRKLSRLMLRCYL